MLTSDFDVVAEMLDLYRVFYHQPSDLEKTRAYLKMIFFDDDIVIFVARNPDTKDYCGFYTLLPSFSTVKASNVFVLNDLFIKEEYRRAGTGAFIIIYEEPIFISLRPLHNCWRCDFSRAKSLPNDLPTAGWRGWCNCGNEFLHNLSSPASEIGWASLNYAKVSHYLVC